MIAGQGAQHWSSSRQNSLRRSAVAEAAEDNVRRTPWGRLWLPLREENMRTAPGVRYNKEKVGWGGGGVLPIPGLCGRLSCLVLVSACTHQQSHSHISAVGGKGLSRWQARPTSAPRPPAPATMHSRHACACAPTHDIRPPPHLHTISSNPSTRPLPPSTPAPVPRAAPNDARNAQHPLPTPSPLRPALPPLENRCRDSTIRLTTSAVAALASSVRPTRQAVPCAV